VAPSKNQTESESVRVRPTVQLETVAVLKSGRPRPSTRDRHASTRDRAGPGQILEAGDPT
jgi:hypothetical protein